MDAVILHSDSGANLNLIVELAKRLKIDVTPLSPEQIEEFEDAKLLASMLEAREEGLADRETMRKKLGLQ
jgi:hypothetical protein